LNSQPGRRLLIKTRIVSLVVILANVLGNFSLSWGMKRGMDGLSFTAAGLLRMALSPWVLLGVSLLIVWLFTRMALLSWADLSYVLPVTSIGYVLTAAIGKYFFDERISWQRWTGTLFIVAGIALVGRTRPNTTTLAQASHGD
jgi:drug/metabolite transporter (DMT)-like permease